MKAGIPLALFLLIAGNVYTLSGNSTDWLPHARITTPYGYDLSWEEGIARAVENGANVILDWAGFSDTYQGRILYFNASLEEFRQRVEYVHTHYPDVKYMVYIGPLEMGTPDSDLNKDGKDDDGKGSAYTDHPEWLQVGIDGRKAVFYGSMPGMPFWVDETSEDVWLSPSNREYRSIIMNIAREIASTGVDAIWFDVPHLCFDFGDNWQNQWSTVDKASRNDFYNDTGLLLPSPPLQPDWNNETWLRFVEWRYKQILDFVGDFNKAVKEGNPNCKLVIETSSDGGVHMTQIGCSIIDMPNNCDVIAHEYTGPVYEVQYYTWLHMLSTLKLWHDFDKNASWLLSYVEKGRVNLARFHAALVLTMGFNYYTSGGEGMAEIVDEQFMHDFFGWLKEHDDYFYEWDSNADIAVVFSRHTLDYLDRGSWEEYAYHDEFLGILMMLIESNIPFKVIDEEALDNITSYDAIILPDFACMSEEQANMIREYVKDGGTVIAINETSLYNEYGVKRDDFSLKDVFGVGTNEAEFWEIYENSYGGGRCIFTPTPLGRYFYWAAQPWSNFGNRKEAESTRNEFLKLIEKANISLSYSIEGNAIAIPYEKDGQKMLRILNFESIRLGNAVPSLQEIEIRIKGEVKEANLLNFMDDWEDIDVEKEGENSIIRFTLNTQACLIYSTNESNLYASIVEPQEGKIYFMNREIMSISSNKAIIIGSININVDTNGDRVEFYIDDILKYTDEEIPYQWKWDELAFGMHKIIVKAYNGGNAVVDEINVIIFNI